MDDRSSTDAFEQLTEMYLTGTDAEAVSREAIPALRLTRDEDGPRARSRSEAMRVEGVLVGHLPGFANLWVGQYAQRLARQSGPVAVLIAERGSVEVELYTGRAVEPDRGVWDGAGGWSLGRVLDELAERVRLVLLRLPVEMDAEALAYANALDSITLLTGSDDAAVVGGYRRLKGLMAARDMGIGVPRVRLFVCGCDSLDAERTAERLHRTAIEHLRITPALAGSQQKMEPVRKQQLGHYEVASSWEALGVLLPDRAAVGSEIDSVDDPEVFVEAHTEPERELELSDLVLDEEDLLDDAELEALESFAAVFEESRSRGGAEDAYDRALEEEIAAYADDEEEAITAGLADEYEQVETEDDVVPAAPVAPVDRVEISDELFTLARYVDGADLLEVRCPAHDAVELGIDGAGRLHLMARTSAEPRDTLRELMDARAWAVEHAEVLRLTPGAGALDGVAEPMLHVFTDMPKALGELAYRGKADSRPIRLHLLLPVTVGDATTWSHVELN